MYFFFLSELPKYPLVDSGGVYIGNVFCLCSRTYIGEYGFTETIRPSGGNTGLFLSFPLSPSLAYRLRYYQISIKLKSIFMHLHCKCGQSLLRCSGIIHDGMLQNFTVHSFVAGVRNRTKFYFSALSLFSF